MDQGVCSKDYKVLNYVSSSNRGVDRNVQNVEEFSHFHHFSFKISKSIQGRVALQHKCWFSRVFQLIYNYDQN